MGEGGGGGGWSQIKPITFGNELRTYDVIPYLLESTPPTTCVVLTGVHRESSFETVLAGTVPPSSAIITDAMLEEIARVLKPGGRLVLREPTCPIGMELPFPIARACARACVCVRVCVCVCVCVCVFVFLAICNFTRAALLRFDSL